MRTIIASAVTGFDMEENILSMCLWFSPFDMSFTTFSSTHILMENLPLKLLKGIRSGDTFEVFLNSERILLNQSILIVTEL